MVAIAFLRLHPIQRKLAELEIKNIQDYFNSELVTPKRRQKLNSLAAFMMILLSSFQRMAQVSKQARQDYYALNRRGRYAVDSLPDLVLPPHLQAPSSYEALSPRSSADSKTPILIIPGLNTPPVFFREMYTYFAALGYHVSVMTLPENGLASVTVSAQHVQNEVNRLRDMCQTDKVNLIGHCLGGIIGKYFLENEHITYGDSPVKNLISLGTGFMGADGVENLKNLWIPRNPNKPIPTVFDELIQWNLNVAQKSKEVAYYSFLTIWDFMVYFRKGLLENQHDGTVNNVLIDDPAIDHLTLALNPKIFQQIEAILSGKPVDNGALCRSVQMV